MSQITQRFRRMNGRLCSCGRRHTTGVRQLLAGQGVLNQLPDQLVQLGVTHPFILADRNTYAAAGEQVTALLTAAGIDYTLYVLPLDSPKPDEQTVGRVMLHIDTTCDGVIGVGSGVINDTAKLLCSLCQKPYIIVGTAPSMDGYASALSSMDRDGLKVSLPTRCADVIIGDTDILCAAPGQLLISGLGDMLAKYISICEWRIAALVTGEYYCEEIADLVRGALACCVENADGLLQRQPRAVQAVFEGLVICGAAMAYAGLSRPASGVEHYFSHIWDMRALAFGTPCSTHGIQCGAASLQALRLYSQLRTLSPDRQKALASVAAFDKESWFDTLRGLVGPGAQAMIAAEARDGKYDPEKHAARLEVILTHWQDILQIMDEELPPVQQLQALLDTVGIPQSPAAFGVPDSLLPDTFRATKDIRDKYVLSRLCWDLGVLDTLADSL